MIDDDRARNVRALLRRPAVVATIATLSLALVFGGLAWSARPQTTSTTPTTTPAPSDAWASLAPSPTDGPAGPAGTPILSARGVRGGVVPLETGFRLESSDATPASALVAGLSVDPPVAWTTQVEDGDRAVTLTPTEPLHPGYVYRFDLHTTSGALLETWAFQASQPVRVVGTLPENQSSEVPTDTGIEITFDQDGVTGAANHISIAPATEGRFEQHDRTIVFVPDRPLKPATIYSVTVSRGVSVEGTGEASIEDTRFRFETAATTGAASRPLFGLQQQVSESPVADRPTIGVWYFGDEDTEAPAPKTMPIEVYRLGDLGAGVAAFRTIRSRPDWTSWSTEGRVDTAGLVRVVAAKVLLEPFQGSFFTRLPEALEAGWYLVQIPDKTRPSQAVLQVTNVAGYLAVSGTRTLVWANDLASAGPIAGASAASGDTVIDTTDADGLADGTTPAGLLPRTDEPCTLSCDPVVTITTGDGRAVFLPANTTHDKLEVFGDSYFWSDADQSFWALLHPDRDRYRTTDTVNVWGAIRRRDDGTVPSTVTVQLTPEPYDDSSIRPPTATVAAQPAPSGAFTASMALAGVAEGTYRVDLVVDGRTIRTTYVTVGPIVKPAYRLEILTGRRVYIAGDRIRVDVDASFFEGTPVPGVPLRIEGYVERAVTTDASGHAVHRTTASVDADQEGPGSKSVDVSPARPEEGEISGASREFVVFPSSRTIATNATIAGGRVKVTGDVHLVDVERLEAAIADGSYIWDLDPRGAAVRGATVTIRFIEQIPVRTRSGTEYDFIEKRVVPVYETRIDERIVDDVRVKTAADGSFSASILATTTDHDYRVVASIGDPDGHRARITTGASRHSWEAWDSERATLLPSKPVSDDGAYGIGDRVDVTLNDPDVPQTGGDGTRYLFFEAQRGIHAARVQASRRYTTTFDDADAPNLAIGGVRFTGHGYVAVSFDARFRSTDRALSVDLSSTAARYAPGDTATVDIRTRDAAGHGIAASVVLRAVDEKLFTMGAASVDDPLNELYASVTSGVTGSYASHRTPSGETTGVDTTGGGGDDREDFRDVVLFRMVETDATGHATVSFAVSDDLTSWRVSASAITADLQAGYGSVLVPVGLPFFVDASVAGEYLVADRPSIPVRVFGSAIEAGDPATIRVTSKSLGFDSGPIAAEAFKTMLVPLPRLTAGTHTITFTATSGSGAAARTDRLTRAFTVVPTRLTTTQTAYVELPGQSAIRGGDGLTRVVISDATAGRYLGLLTNLASGGGARLDRGLAADVAAGLLVRDFGMASDGGPTEAVMAARYQRDGGLSLMPYSSSDPWLSSLVALMAPNGVDASQLAGYLSRIRSDPAETRERQTIALAGLAGLGQPVLPELRAAAADTTYTIRERLLIGLGAARLGDGETARNVATALRAGFGEQAGSLARLRVGTTAADITEATALMAVLAASVGDPLAPDYWAYVEANPAIDQLHVLEGAAFVAEVLDRAPVKPIKFAYVLDGTRETVTLGGGQSLELSLDAKRLATLQVEPIDGSIGVATSWSQAIDPARLAPDPDVTIERDVSPSGTLDPSDLLSVTLTVAFGPQAATGCHEVTEFVPSGLTPVGPSAAWIGDEGEEGVASSLVGVEFPYDTSGPRVSFCAEPTREHRTVRLRYYARVVNPGAFAWEPAIAASRSQALVAARTPTRTLTIR